MSITKELMDILACPQCKGTVVQTKDGDWLVCIPCGIRFPVRGEMPVMLLDEAEKLPGSGE